MIRTAAGLALLFNLMTSAAQNGAGTDASSIARKLNSARGSAAVTYPTMSAGCPIDMHASQGLWDRTVRVYGGDKELAPPQFGQRISLNLKGPNESRSISATVRVRGLNGKSRSLPTPAGTSQRWNATRTLRLDFVEEKDGTFTGDLWIGGFTAVDSVQLMNVSYSDGSMWTISGYNACRVQPDPVMLITER